MTSHVNQNRVQKHVTDYVRLIAFYQAASQYHVRRCGLSLQMEQRGLSVCLSVCLSGTVITRAKTAEPIEMLLWTRVAPRNRVLDGVQILLRRGNFEGGGAVYYKL